MEVKAKIIMLKGEKGDVNLSQLKEEKTIRQNNDNNLQSQINGLASGSPLVASSTSGMTDTTRVYVNTTDGKWYYYNGTEWTIGGVYQASEDSSTVQELEKSINDTMIRTRTVNIFHYTSSDVETGKYYSASSGQFRDGESYDAFTNYLDVEENEPYVFAIYRKNDNTYHNLISCITCWYDVNKQFISGIAVNDSNQPITSPSNAKYLRFSIDRILYTTYNLLIAKGNTPPEMYSSYVPGHYEIDTEKLDMNYIKEQIGYVNYHTITVKQDETGDFTKVQDAIASITNNSATNRYIIEISEGNYNLASDFTSQQLEPTYNFAGIFVPDFVKLIGIGDKKKVVLFADLETKHQYISALNFRNEAYIENLTVRGTKTRYAVHDDLADNIGGYKRIMKDVIMKGVDTYYSVSCGCGTKEGADWYYENVIFDGTECGNGSRNGLAYTVHNNAGFTKHCNIKFKNCRFLTNIANGAVLLKSIIQKASSGATFNNMMTNVQFVGCKLGTGAIGLSLVEENATAYGRGCAYNVSGYANVNDEYTIVTTDGIDYSDRVDLI